MDSLKKVKPSAKKITTEEPDSDEEDVKRVSDTKGFARPPIQKKPKSVEQFYKNIQKAFPENDSNLKNKTFFIAINDDLNVDLVERGWAWHFVRFAKDNKALAEAEQSARAARRGLWSEDGAVSPWDYRRQQEQAPK